MRFRGVDGSARLARKALEILGNKSNNRPYQRIGHCGMMVERCARMKISPNVGARADCPYAKSLQVRFMNQKSLFSKTEPN